MITLAEVRERHEYDRRIYADRDPLTIVGGTDHEHIAFLLSLIDEIEAVKGCVTSHCADLRRTADELEKESKDE